jgi:predicted GTPase
MVMNAGVDYEQILRRAEAEADVVIWDGGNNDFPFITPDLLLTVTDPLRPGDEVTYHPGEVTLRMADVVVVNKVDTAPPAAVAEVVATVTRVNPRATIVTTASPVTLEPGPSLVDQRVLVIEDGPSLTHGGMATGAGTVAARRARVREVIDPRPYAVGSIADAFARHPRIGLVLPAMAYGDDQMDNLAATVAATPCDVVVTGTPIDLRTLLRVDVPVRRATYEHDPCSIRIPWPTRVCVARGVPTRCNPAADIADCFT